MFKGNILQSAILNSESSSIIFDTRTVYFESDIIEDFPLFSDIQVFAFPPIEKS